MIRTAASPAKKPARSSVAAAYIRVSSEEQTQGHSLDYQRDACVGAAEKLGAASTVVYEDAGFSAKTADRPAFQRLIEDAEAGHVGTVIVYRLDRFARNRLDSLIFKERLRKAGVKLISVTEPLDDTPAGLITEGMLELIAEWYSLDLKTKVTSGLRKRAEKGLMNGLPPFGYAQSARPQADPPTVVPAEAAAVRDAYEWFATGLMTYKDIARRLNLAGWRTRHRPTKRDADGARLWTGDSVRALIQNPVYRGVVTHKSDELPGRHEAIVGEAPWHQANRAGERLRGKSTTWKPVRFYPLAGIAKCAGCGSNLQGNHSKSGEQYRYYRETAHRRGLPCPKPQIAVRADRLEAEVDTIVAGLRASPELRDAVLEQLGAPADGEDVVAELDRRRERLRRLARLYADLEITEVEYEAQRRRLEAEVARLSVPVERASEAAGQFDVLQLAWSRATPEEKRALGLALFEAIYFDLETMEIAHVLIQPSYRPWLVGNGQL